MICGTWWGTNILAKIQLSSSNRNIGDQSKCQKTVRNISLNIDLQIFSPVTQRNSSGCVLCTQPEEPGKAELPNVSVMVVSHLLSQVRE